MRRIAVPLLVSALLTAGGLIVATPTAACSCMGGTTQEFFDRADAVFTARLVSRIEPSGEIISSADPALHVFAVDSVFKGTAHEEQEVLSPTSGASCGLELHGDEPVVVFATRSADGGDDRYTAGLCDGTAPATADLEAELRALAGPAGSGTPEPGDDGGAAAPPDTVGPGGTGAPGLPTPALGAGALALVLVGWLLLRRRASSRADDGDASVP